MLLRRLLRDLVLLRDLDLLLENLLLRGGDLLDLLLELDLLPYLSGDFLLGDGDCRLGDLLRLLGEGDLRLRDLLRLLGDGDRRLGDLLRLLGDGDLLLGGERRLGEMERLREDDDLRLLTGGDRLIGGLLRGDIDNDLLLGGDLLLGDGDDLLLGDLFLGEGEDLLGGDLLLGDGRRLGGDSECFLDSDLFGDRFLEECLPGLGDVDLFMTRLISGDLDRFLGVGLLDLEELVDFRRLTGEDFFTVFLGLSFGRADDGSGRSFNLSSKLLLPVLEVLTLEASDASALTGNGISSVIT